MLDKAAAPEGHHVLHAYLPATEPYGDARDATASTPMRPPPLRMNPASPTTHLWHRYERWEGLERTSDDYRRLKEERSQRLWQAVEEFIPDIRERAVVSSVGTPLTHERFLRRHKGTRGPAHTSSPDPNPNGSHNLRPNPGTYGPAFAAWERAFPGHKSPVDGLWCDSTFPTLTPTLALTLSPCVPGPNSKVLRRQYLPRHRRTSGRGLGHRGREQHRAPSEAPGAARRAQGQAVLALITNGTARDTGIENVRV